MMISLVCDSASYLHKHEVNLMTFEFFFKALVCILVSVFSVASDVFYNFFELYLLNVIVRYSVCAFLV